MARLPFPEQVNFTSTTSTRIRSREYIFSLRDRFLRVTRERTIKDRVQSIITFSSNVTRTFLSASNFVHGSRLSSKWLFPPIENSYYRRNVKHKEYLITQTYQNSFQLPSIRITILIRVNSWRAAFWLRNIHNVERSSEKIGYAYVSSKLFYFFLPSASQRGEQNRERSRLTILKTPRNDTWRDRKIG